MTLIEDVHSIIERASQGLANARYNTRILQFFVNNMMKMKQLPGFADDGSEQFAIGKRDLLNALQSGERQIQRHAQIFDLKRFQTVEEVRYIIETLCENFWNALQYLKVGMNLHIQTTIPIADVNKDKNFLSQQLRFVLGRSDPVPGCSFMEEWQTAKDALYNQLKDIKKDDLKLDLNEKTCIGEGGSCIVYKATWNNQCVAVKQLQTSSDDDDDDKDVKLARFAIEAALNASVSHKNIVRVLAMDVDGLLVMELADESLEGWYQGRNENDNRVKLHLLNEAAAGLEHLHARGLVHRDVKCSNFLVFMDTPESFPTVKLCDLGIAEGWSEECGKTTFTPQPGTKLYLAPEIHDGRPHSFASDVFSMGIVMCEVIANIPPYLEVATDVLMLKKLDGMMPCSLPYNCPLDLKKLITQCLSLNPKDRPNMRRVKETIERLLKSIN